MWEEEEVTSGGETGGESKRREVSVSTRQQYFKLMDFVWKLMDLVLCNDGSCIKNDDSTRLDSKPLAPGSSFTLTTMNILLKTMNSVLKRWASLRDIRRIGWPLRAMRALRYASCWPTGSRCVSYCFYAAFAWFYAVFTLFVCCLNAENDGLCRTWRARPRRHRSCGCSPAAWPALQSPYWFSWWECWFVYGNVWILYWNVRILFYKCSVFVLKMLDFTGQDPARGAASRRWGHSRRVWIPQHAWVQPCLLLSSRVHLGKLADSQQLAAAQRPGRTGRLGE